MKARILGLFSLALLPLALVSSTGCEEAVTYSYFSVDVKIDESADADFLRRVYSCAAIVMGSRTDSGELRCAPGTRNLGKFEYSTSAKSGNISFTVVVNDVTNVEIGTGTSPEVSVVAGQTVQTSVVVKPRPEALPDAGR
jgi:hypothetical protein